MVKFIILMNEHRWACGIWHARVVRNPLICEPARDQMKSQSGVDALCDANIVNWICIGKNPRTNSSPEFAKQIAKTLFVDVRCSHPINTFGCERFLCSHYPQRNRVSDVDEGGEFKPNLFISILNPDTLMSAIMNSNCIRTETNARTIQNRITNKSLWIGFAARCSAYRHKQPVRIENLSVNSKSANRTQLQRNE